MQQVPAAVKRMRGTREEYQQGKGQVFNQPGNDELCSSDNTTCKSWGRGLKLIPEIHVRTVPVLLLGCDHQSLTAFLLPDLHGQGQKKEAGTDRKQLLSVDEPMQMPTLFLGA